MTKKRDFGLAAQLARPRSSGAVQGAEGTLRDETSAPDKTETQRSNLAERAEYFGYPKALEHQSHYAHPEHSEHPEHPEHSERLEHPEHSERPEHLERPEPSDRGVDSSPSSAEPARAERSGRPVGRPRREGGVERMHLVLAADLMRFVQTRWRTYQRQNDGEFVSGPSAYIEDLIRRDREAQATR